MRLLSDKGKGRIVEHSSMSFAPTEAGISLVVKRGQVYFSLFLLNSFFMLSFVLSKKFPIRPTFADDQEIIEAFTFYGDITDQIEKLEKQLKQLTV